MATEKELENLSNSALANPYDGLNKGRNFAELSALCIIKELSGRSGIGNALDSIDEETRKEIVEAVGQIILHVWQRDRDM